MNGMQWLRAIAVCCSVVGVLAWTRPAAAASATEPASADGAEAAGPAKEPKKKADPVAGLQHLELAAWLKVLGWSRDGSWLAWRGSRHAARNQPGRPCTLARFEDGRALVAELIDLRDQVARQLERHTVHSVQTVRSEQVSPIDVVFKTRDGALLVAVVREGQVALLRKVAGDYIAVWRRRLAHASDQLRAFAWQAPVGSLLAIVLQTGVEPGSEADLLLVDLASPATATTTP